MKNLIPAKFFVLALLISSFPSNNLLAGHPDSGCGLVIAAPPYPKRIPSFDQLVVDGYTIKIGEVVTFRGEQGKLSSNSDVNDGISAYGARAKVTSWTVATEASPRKIGLTFDIEPSRAYFFSPQEIVKSPEIQATFSEKNLGVADRVHENRDYIFVDRYKDPETNGFINRALVDKSIINYHDDVHSGGYVIFKFAKNFKLAQKLGFDFDPKTNIIYYPDEASFNERLKVVYKEWGVRDGIQSREINGVISEHEYARLILDDNVIGRASIEDYHTHWHDLDSHTLGWLVAVDVMPIMRERLKFLFAAEKVVSDYQAANPNFLQEAESIKKKLSFLIDRVEIYKNIEVGLPEGREVAGLLDPEPAHARGLLTIETGLLKVGGTSAKDYKDDVMAFEMPEDLRVKLGAVSASNRKIGEAQVGPLIKKIKSRFF